jgi:pilus assembly protein CpaB
MNLKTWVPLVLAIGLGLVAMKIAHDMTMKTNPGLAADGGMKVVVLKKDVPAGKPLTSDDLSTVKMAGDVNPEAVFSDPDKLEKRVVVTNAIKGTPVIETMLAPQGSGSGMQALIPEGMRAITVEINEFSGVAGFLVPGCRVDIVSTFQGDKGEMLSRTVVQNVKVQTLGMRQQTDATGDQPQGPTRSVTLIATPSQAEAIELTTSTGHPRLVLRSYSDNQPALTEGVTIAELRRGGPDAGNYAEPIGLSSTTQPSGTPRMRQIKVIRGGIESNTNVPEIAAPITQKWMTTGANTEEIPSGNAR